MGQLVVVECYSFICPKGDGPELLLRKRVIVVDDNVDAATALATMLRIPEK